MNNDLISRKALKEELENDIEYAIESNFHSAYVRALSRVIARTNDVPTIDAEPVRHGRWKKTCLSDVFMCSDCKNPAKMDELCKSRTLWDYCPNCGAKMDGDSNG